MYSTTDFRKGLKIEVDGTPYDAAEATMALPRFVNDAEAVADQFLQAQARLLAPQPAAPRGVEPRQVVPPQALPFSQTRISSDSLSASELRGHFVRFPKAQ